MPAGDDPVRDVLPELSQLGDRPAGAPAISFRHLASHTAGLIREPRLEGSTDGPLEFWEDKILESIPTTAFYTLPGVSYQYSNIGFGMRSWRYAAIVNDGVVESWFEEPGLSDNCETDPYGETSPQNVLNSLIDSIEPVRTVA